MLNIERFVCNPFQENCYVVSDETGEGVIIDCGAFYPEERRAVTEYIKTNRLTVKHLLATHAHIDHNFGNNTIKEEFDLSPNVSAADSALMGRLSEQAMILANIRLDYDMPAVGRFFDGSDIFKFGTHRLAVLPTPGHSPGSVFFYCEEENVAFSGDTLFNMSIGRTDFDFGSYHDIMDSLHNVVCKLPDETNVYPGHGPQTTIRQEKQYNPYLR